MQPLYILSLGKPGSSYAFEIAQKIGLNKDVLESAKKKVGNQEIEIKNSPQFNSDIISNIIYFSPNIINPIGDAASKNKKQGIIKNEFLDSISKCNRCNSIIELIFFINSSLSHYRFDVKIISK